MSTTQMRQESQQPFQTFVMVLGLLTSIPLLLSKTPGPASIEAQLPPIGVFVWAVCLTVGTALALLGAYWPRTRLTALLVEQLGLGLAGIACAFYGILILKYAGANGQPGISAGLILGFALACGSRFWRIQRFLKAIRRAVKVVGSSTNG